MGMVKNVRGMRLFGWTRSSRHAAISWVTDAIVGIGGSLLDSHVFSNTALTLRLEIPAVRATELARAIARCSMTLDAESTATLQRITDEYRDQRDEVAGTLNVRFVHNEPDLRIETLAVPG